MATGVYTTQKKDGTIYYRVSLTHKSKHISLGSFSDYASANQVYRESSDLLRAEQSRHFIDISDYTTSFHQCRSPISFDKFICLMNLRDNHIYIKNPIYLCHKYFLYFLDEYMVLKFDIEDLFYYSEHKIMNRGGYFFVNDFGMQTSILHRFGIRPHSVKGKDYEFRNGDEHDYRYENVLVINRYHGVTRMVQDGRTMYHTRLHINGDYTVGIYQTESEAAVAYNRAIDLLADQYSNSKNYPKNYIDGLSHIEYASIYNTVKISKKFRRYIETLSSQK